MEKRAHYSRDFAIAFLEIEPGQFDYWHKLFDPRPDDKGLYNFAELFVYRVIGFYLKQCNQPFRQLGLCKIERTFEPLLGLVHQKVVGEYVHILDVKKCSSHLILKEEYLRFCKDHAYGTRLVAPLFELYNSHWQRFREL